jgi:DNA-binding NarL/FixJ family response regulator
MPGGDPAKTLRIMLVEDHASFRKALAFVLDREPEFEVVAQAGSLAEARQALEEIDMAVVDLALPDGNGAEFIHDLYRYNPGTRVLVLSATLDPSSFALMIEAGAGGVLDKLAGLHAIVGALRRLEAGGAMPQQEEVVRLLRLFGEQPDPSRGTPTAVESLTPRESEVLQALAEGLDSEGIVKKLGITTEEEQASVSSILDKLGARSRLHALAIAARQGTVEIR